MHTQINLPLPATKLTRLTRRDPTTILISTICLSIYGNYPIARLYARQPDSNPTHVEIVNRDAAIRAWKTRGFRLPANITTVSYAS